MRMNAPFKSSVKAVTKSISCTIMTSHLPIPSPLHSQITENLTDSSHSSHFHISYSPYPKNPKSQPIAPFAHPPCLPKVSVPSFQAYISQQIPNITNSTKNILNLCGHHVAPKFIRYALIYFRGNEDETLAFIENGNLEALGMKNADELISEMKREYEAHRDGLQREEQRMMSVWREEMTHWEAYEKLQLEFEQEQAYIQYWRSLFHRLHHELDREVWMQVFSYLQLDEVLQCRLIWRQWHAFLTGNTFWNRVVHEKCSQKELNWMVHHAASNVLVKSSMRELYLQVLYTRSQSSTDDEGIQSPVGDGDAATLTNSKKIRSLSFTQSLRLALGNVPSPSLSPRLESAPHTPRQPFNCTNLLSKDFALIVDFLNEVDLYACRQVCMHWAEYLSIKSSPLWRQLALLRFDEFRYILTRTQSNNWREVYQSYAMIRSTTVAEELERAQLDLPAWSDMPHLYSLSTTSASNLTTEDRTEIGDKNALDTTATDSTDDGVSDWGNDGEGESVVDEDVLSLDDVSTAPNSLMDTNEIFLERKHIVVRITRKETTTNKSTENMKSKPSLHEPQIEPEDDDSRGSIQPFNNNSTHERSPNAIDTDDSDDGETQSRRQSLESETAPSIASYSTRSTEAPQLTVAFPCDSFNLNDLPWDSMVLKKGKAAYGTFDMEHLVQIFSFLPMNSWNAARLVNAHWYRASLVENTYYGHLLTTLYGKDAQWINECASLSVKQWDYVLSNMHAAFSFQDSAAAEWAQDLGINQLDAQTGALQEEFEMHVKNALKLEARSKKGCCVVS